MTDQRWSPSRADTHFFDRNVWDHSGQAEDIVGCIQWDDEHDEHDEHDHIVVRNRRMSQQSGEGWY